MSFVDSIFVNLSIFYSLKNIFNPQINTCSTFTVICRHMQSNEKLDLSEVHALSCERTRWGSVLSYFTAHTVNRCPSGSWLNAPFFAFLCFLVFLLFKIAPKLSAEVLPGSLKCKKAVTCLTEKIMLHLSMSYCATGCEFGISESTICIK